MAWVMAADFTAGWQVPYKIRNFPVHLTVIYLDIQIYVDLIVENIN